MTERKHIAERMIWKGQPATQMDETEVFTGDFQVSRYLGLNYMNIALQSTSTNNTTTGPSSQWLAQRIEACILFRHAGPPQTAFSLFHQDLIVSRNGTGTLVEFTNAATLSTTVKVARSTLPRAVLQLTHLTLTVG